MFPAVGLGYRALSFLGIRLNPFTKRAQMAVVGHPKFYFFDAGVYRAIRPTGPIDSPEEARFVPYVFSCCGAFIQYS